MLPLGYKYAFNEDEMKLAFIFNVFGATIINNINNNIRLSVDSDMVKLCKECGKEIKLTTNNSKAKYCKSCGIEINKDKTKKRMKNIRS